MSEFRNNIGDAKKVITRVRKTMPKAYYAAMQRAGQQTKTHASRLVREKYHVKARDINERVTLRRGSVNNPFLEIRAKGRNVQIIKFRTNPNKPPAPAGLVYRFNEKTGQTQSQFASRKVKPVRAAVKRSGLKEIKGAFITKVGKGGHVGVFKRAGRRRLPIKEVHGPAVPVMMGQPETIVELMDFASDKFKQRLDHEIKRRMGDVVE